MAHTLLSCIAKAAAMQEGAVHSRQGSELAFSLLRVLTTGHFLWGSECNLSMVELVRTLHAPSAEVARAVATLWDLNLVTLDASRHTIRLTQTAVQLLMTRRDIVS